MEVNKEKNRYILHAFFDKDKNASQAAEIVNGVYGADTVTANYVQFWFRRFRSSIFDVKDASRTGRRVGQTLNSYLYCEQLDHLKLEIDQKRPELANRRGAVFHQDNARPQTFVVIRQKLWEFVWEVLMYPPFRPNLAPSDCRLFLALQSFLCDKKLGSREDCKNRLLEFFANKDQDFYERSIMKLPLKWQKIIQQNGAYLTEIGQSETC
ncbi:mariner Mos1 transposase [Trichonephila clavipes]|nr:mariner Mos1 transposase [Trichonephila clavipes]